MPAASHEPSILTLGDYFLFFFQVLWDYCEDRPGPAGFLVYTMALAISSLTTAYCVTLRTMRRFIEGMLLILLLYF